MLKLKKVLTVLIVSIISLLLLLLIASAIIIALGVRIELNSLRKPVASTLQQTLGRNVQLNGDISLIPTLWPTLEIKQVLIDNPPGWSQTEFAEAELMRIQLGLMPLLNKQIQFGEITINGISINLENNSQGEANWHFKTSEQAVEQVVEVDADNDVSIIFTGVNEIALEDININYYDQQINRRLSFALRTMQGQALPGENLQLQITGAFQHKAYALDINAGSLTDLHDKSQNWPVYIKANLANTPVEIEGHLIRTAEPELHTSLKVGYVDIGEVLSWLQIADHVDASSDSLTLQSVIRGKSLAQLLALSEFNMTLQQAVWTLQDANTQAQFPIRIEQGHVSVKAAKPININLLSQVGPAPLSITMQGPTLAELGKENISFPVNIDVEGANAQLNLYSEMTLPLHNNLNFELLLKGQRLDSFNQFVNTELPALGPYELAGGFAVTADGYRIHDLSLQVGESNLQGEIDLATTQTPPLLSVKLSSKQIQINDFDVNTQAVQKHPDEKQKTILQDKLAHQQQRTEVRKLLSPEVFQSLNANVDIEVINVLSAQDSLGKGYLKLSLQQGQLEMKPLHLDIPGGEVDLQLKLFPQADHIDVSLAGKVKEFDYGVLARSIDKNSTTVGKISLDVAITANVKDRKDLLANGSGHFDFAVLPGSMNADIFDLWAINILNVIVSKTDKESSSRVNCAIASFILNKGIMQQKVLFMDTSKMQLEGTAHVDFKTRQIELYIEPRAKRAEFFSFAVPVKVNGEFEDFGIGINPAELAGTVVTFVTSPVMVPISRVFKEAIPGDGKEACATVWQQRAAKE